MEELLLKLMPVRRSDVVKHYKRKLAIAEARMIRYCRTLVIANDIICNQIMEGKL